MRVRVPASRNIEGRMVGNGPVNQSDSERVLITSTNEKGKVYGYQEKDSDSIARAQR